MIPIEKPKTKEQILEEKESLLKRRKVQYDELLLQFKIARRLFACLCCILLVVILLGSGILRLIRGNAFMFVAIAVILIFIVGYFGAIGYGSKFCKTMGKSTETAFLLTFGSFGFYALYWVIRFYLKNNKKESEEEIIKLEKEIAELKTSI